MASRLQLILSQAFLDRRQIETLVIDAGAYNTKRIRLVEIHYFDPFVVNPVGLSVFRSRTLPDMTSPVRHLPLRILKIFSYHPSVNRSIRRIVRIDQRVYCPSYSNLSKCSSLVRTTCLLVSSISPAKNTSSSMA